MAHTAGNVVLSHLTSAFVAPLLLSPLLATVSTAGLYLFFRAWRLNLGIDKESCICVGPEVVHSVLLPATGESLLKPISTWRPTIGPQEFCRHTYIGNFLGISVARALDRLHYLSAGAVGFARGLNDTPKITALLVASTAIPVSARYALVALFIALGGWLSARRVAETISHRITHMNPGQGFSANVVTAFLVIGASRLGMPVSTTHVSVGSLFGIGLLSGRANNRVILSIISSWVVTLPLAAALAAAISLLF